MRAHLKLVRAALWRYHDHFLDDLTWTFVVRRPSRAEPMIYGDVSIGSSCAPVGFSGSRSSALG